MTYNGSAIQLTELDTDLLHMQFNLQEESVNKFNALASKEFSEVLDLLEQTPPKGLLISSAKESFIVGADVMEFGAVFAHGRAGIAQHVAINARAFNRLEDLPCPTVVAINGYAFGGGFELCLACDFRLMSSTARVGLPEVKLGILPGWGGTVRLPRLAGLDTALEWMATGNEQNAQAALKAGVVDGVVAPEDLVASAGQILRRAVSGTLEYQSRRVQKQAPLKHNATESLMAFETAKMLVLAKAGKNYPAPVAIVETVQKAARHSRDNAQKIELESFVNLTQTSAAKALVGLFVNDQMLSKKARRWEKANTAPVKSAAVLGAGIMGGGIAYQSASRKIPIRMKDIAQAGLDAGMAEASKLLTRQLERGKITAPEMLQVLHGISPVLTYDGFDETDIVIEAVVERLDVKQKVLGEVEALIRQDAVLCSNTSTISIDRLAEKLKRPENFCGMHFFNPVHKMPLVEVIRGSKTSDATVARTVSYATSLGKKAVVVKNCPGFFVNRVLFPYFAGFSMLLRDGADYRQVDRVMERFGWPMGPAWLLDVVGMDVAVHADRVMSEGFPDRMRRDYKSAMEALYEADRLGQKNSQGFYDHQTDRKGRPEKVSSEAALQLVKSVQAKNEDFSDEDIVARTMIPMAIEVVRCLEEGIIDSPGDADIALIYGLGFPPFRGGVFRWIDDMGIAAFAATARNYEHLGPLYTMTESLRAQALSGESFTRQQGSVR